MYSKKLKYVDKIVGTPLCLCLGLFDSVVHFFVKKPTFDAGLIKKVLVIKLVAIGDLVVALPTLKALRGKFKDAHIALLTTPRVRQVVEGSPFVDEIIYYDVFGKHRGIAGILRMLFRLRDQDFDLVIELGHYYRITTLFSYFSGAPYRVGFDLPGQGRRDLFTIKVPYDVNKHEVDVFLDTARAVGAEPVDSGMVEVPFPQEDTAYIERILGKVIKQGRLLIGIHTGTGKSAISRRWINQRWAQLVDTLVEKYNANVVFTGTQEEESIVIEIMNHMKQEPVNLTGQTTLKQFAALAKLCDLFISLDTGPMHIVASEGTPVVALFGPNTPTKWGPYGNNHKVVYKKLPCSPCTRQYMGEVSTCQNNLCMQAISVEDVLSAVDELVKKQKSKGSGLDI